MPRLSIHEQQDRKMYITGWEEGFLKCLELVEHDLTLGKKLLPRYVTSLTRKALAAYKRGDGF